MKQLRYTQPFIEEAIVYEQTAYGSKTKTVLSIYLPSYVPLITYEKVCESLTAIKYCLNILFPHIPEENITLHVTRKMYDMLSHHHKYQWEEQINRDIPETIYGFNLEVIEDETS